MTMTPSSLRIPAIALACATLLSACGGGDDDAPSGGNTAIAQAKKSFAHTFVGSLYIDAVAGVIYDKALRTVFSLPGQSQSGTVNCNPVGGSTGTLAYVYTDTDGSGSVTVGDVIASTLNNCSLGGLQPLTGTANLTVANAVNAETFYLGIDAGNGVAGSLGFTMTLTNLAQAGVGTTLNGDYQLGLSRASANGNLNTTVQATTMTVATNLLTTTFRNFMATGVSTVAGVATTNTLGGSVDTTVDGLGAVTYTMTLPTPITTTGGQVRLQSTTQTLQLTLTATDAVNIQVDNGNNGTVDLDFNGTLSELSNLVFTK